MDTCKYNSGVKNMRFNEKSLKLDGGALVQYVYQLIVATIGTLFFLRFVKQKAYMGIGAYSPAALERPRSGGHLYALKS